MTGMVVGKEAGRPAGAGATGGTRSFAYSGGRAVHGAQPELVFRLMIEEELDRAAAATARGVRGTELYETLTHTPLDDAPGT